MEYQTVKKITLSKQERTELDYIWRLANRFKLPESYFYGRSFGENLTKKLQLLQKNAHEIDIRIAHLLKTK